MAQAAHWFELDAFYKAVNHVLRDDGLIALWTYGLHRIDDACDRIIGNFYEQVVGAYWPPERRLIEAEYKTLPFPFKRLDTPTFTIERHWTLAEELDYLRTWSAVQRFQSDRGYDPVSELESDLDQRWRGQRRVRWPITVLLGAKR